MIIYTTIGKIAGTRYQQLQSRVRDRDGQVSIELYKVEGSKHLNVATLVGSKEELLALAQAIVSLTNKGQST